ncbi:MAG: hypothetical protein WCH62_01805 [Candidatus Omnitrophota bacterium]
MMSFLILIIVQLVIAGVVIFFLKNLLDRELEKVAIEKLASLKSTEAVDCVIVYYANSISFRAAEEIKSLTSRKFINGKIVFERLQTLKGGLIIKVANEILDFSLSSRLESFWS